LHLLHLIEQAIAGAFQIVDFVIEIDQFVLHLFAQTGELFCASSSDGRILGGDQFAEQVQTN